MSKSISMFVYGKPFGVFSNKMNAFLAIGDNYDTNDLCIYSEKKKEYLPASYSMLASRLGKQKKCHIFTRAESIKEENKIPAIYVYQFETNVAVNGKLYKSSEKEEKEEVEGIE